MSESTVSRKNIHQGNSDSSADGGDWDGEGWFEEELASPQPFHSDTAKKDQQYPPPKRSSNV